MIDQKRPRGRPKKQITDEQVKRLVERGDTFKEMAIDLDVSISYIVKVWASRIWEWRTK